MMKKRLALALFLVGYALSTITASAQIFVTNEDGNTVSVVDPTTGIAFANITVGSGPDGIAISPNRTRAFVANTDDGTVTVINLTTYTVVTTITVGTDPTGVAFTPDGAKVFVTNTDDGTVSVIDTATNLVTATITLPITAPDTRQPTPGAVAITGSGTKAFVTNDDGVNMYVINTTTNAVTPLNVGIETASVAVTPDGTRVYVGGGLTTGPPGKVRVLNAVTNANVGPLITVGNAPHGLAISPNSARAYVTNQDDATVSVIDTATNTVLTTLTGFSEPVGVLVDPNGQLFYVTDTGDAAFGDPVGFGSDALLAFDTATNRLVYSTRQGADPQRLAILPFFGTIFQVRYAANLNIGDSFVDFTNTGASEGNLCANLYTFDPAEELISCCTCAITPNGLQSLSVLKSLISNPLTPAIPTAAVVKVIASRGACNASVVAPFNLAPGLVAWGTTLHSQSTTPVSYGVTETPFSPAGLSAAELAHITSTCGFIQSNGSGFGICKGCAAGGLGASSSNQ